jgi:hypothetical protein
VGLRNAAIVAFVTLAGCKQDPPPLIDAPVVVQDDGDVDAPMEVCGGGSVAIYGDCTDMSQCGGGCECHDFGHKQICTPMCTQGGSACPAPSPGCSSTGYCRP